MKRYQALLPLMILFGPFVQLHAEEAQPELSVSPVKLDVIFKKGEKKAEVSLTIHNAGQGDLVWRIASVPKWVEKLNKYGKLSGGQAKIVGFRIDLATSYNYVATGTIEINAAGAKGSPVEIPITVFFKKEPVPEPDPIPEPSPDPVPDPFPDVPPDLIEQPIVKPIYAFGLRLGYNVPGSGKDYNVDPIMSIGLLYRRKILPPMIGLELGLDYSAPEIEDGTGSSTMYAGRAAALVFLDKSDMFYLTAGARIVYESFEDATFETDGSTTGSMIDIGAGMTFLNNHADARLAYSLIPGGDNVSGIIALEMSYLF